MTYRAYCRSCKCDFSGTRMFDLHRTGTHAYTHVQGLALDPPVEDGRRCLDASEMTARGWRLDEHRRWTDPARVAQVRRAFRGTPERVAT